MGEKKYNYIVINVKEILNLKKNNEKPPRKELSTTKTPKKIVIDGENPQSKVNNSKVKEITNPLENSLSVYFSFFENVLKYQQSNIIICQVLAYVRGESIYLFCELISSYIGIGQALVRGREKNIYI